MKAHGQMTIKRAEQCTLQRCWQPQDTHRSTIKYKRRLERDRQTDSDQIAASTAVHAVAHQSLPAADVALFTHLAFHTPCYVLSR